MPILTVVVTAYNIETYIAECLQDICGQSLRDIEIVVVDDGSSDATPEIIRRLAADDDRIVPVLLEENSIGGVATAANAGIEHASGTYIGFADGDDRYDPEMFGKLVKAAEAAAADLAMCSYLNWDSTTGETGLPSDALRWNEIAPDGVVDLDTDTRRCVLSLNAVPWRKIYSARLLKEGGLRFPVGDHFFEDNPFHWFSVLSANRLAFVDERLCRHRVNRIGQTMASVDARLLRMFEHHLTIKHWIENNALDGTFRMDLLLWVARQLSWIARKCPAELRRELFDEIRQVVVRHPREDLSNPALVEAIGKRTTRLMIAAAADDFDMFCRCLDGETFPEDSQRRSKRNVGKRIEEWVRKKVRSVSNSSDRTG